MLPCSHGIHDSSRRAYRIHRLLVALALAGTTAWFTAIASRAQTTPPVAREVPTRALPAPASVSPELQRLLAAPVPEEWDHPPTTVEEWTALVDQIARDRGPVFGEFGVEFEPVVVNGVNAYLLTPETIPPENRNRLLMHLHGGCYMMFGGESAMVEGALLAGYGGFKVLSVDYRRPPEHRYPAALDDAVAVWTGALEIETAERMGIFGASAGGALTLSTVLRLKQEGLPLPAAKDMTYAIRCCPRSMET